MAKVTLNPMIKDIRDGWEITCFAPLIPMKVPDDEYWAF